jgi:type I restriction enzyme M protein
MLTDPQLKSKVDALWDRFWSGGIANPLTAIEQMSYLIFLKRLEDMDNSRAASAKRRQQPYRSVFRGNEKCRWSYWSQLPGHEMLKHVRDKVFEFLRNLGSETSSFTQQMQDAVFIIPKASLLQEAVKIIDDMHISTQDMDVQGDLYEYLLKNLTTAGKNGQFRTPRHIIRMIVNLVNPNIGDRICDPAAGTGGFLVAAYNHILETNTSANILEYDSEGNPHHLIGDRIADKKLLKFLKSQALTGYDFDATMTRIGAMNLMLHGIDNPNFRYMDSLSKAYNERELYEVVLANPPFKGSIDKGDINERFSVKTTKTELLFVELMNDLLVTGGRCGVIVPDGVLFGTSNAHISTRRILVDKCKLEGVVSMPSGVFKPYAGVSTAVLVFQKGGTTDNVWFYDMEADGLSLDDKRQPVKDNDIPDVIKQWRLCHSERSEESERMRLAAEPRAKYGADKSDSSVATLPQNDRRAKCFLVPADEIRANKYDLSISRYKEIEHIEIEYEKPEAIMKKVMELEREIATSVTEIQSLMK